MRGAPTSGEARSRAWGGALSVLLLLPGLVVAGGLAGAGAVGQRAAAEEPAVRLEIDDGSGFRPLAGALVPDLRPKVRLTVLAPQARIRKLMLTSIAGGIADTGKRPEVETVDLTRPFDRLTTGERATRELTLRPGSHTFQLEVQTPEGSERLDAGMAAFDRTVGELTTPIRTRFRVDDAVGVAVEQGTLLLVFERGTSLADVSAELRRLKLTPLDWLPDLDLVRARIPGGRRPYELGREIAAGLRPPLLAVVPNLRQLPADEIGEELPKRLTATYKAEAGKRCGGGGEPKVKGCFESGKDKKSELRIFRYHFYYDTFAGHRLVGRLLKGVAPLKPVGIAVVDTGFGNGKTPNPTNIPDDAFFNFARAPFLGFTADGMQLCALAPPKPCDFATDPKKGFDEVEDIGIVPPGTDKQRDPHGTLVATAAAGRPGAGDDARDTLGTGPHARVRVIRVAQPRDRDRPPQIGLADAARGVVAAARDPNVDVINTSLGAGDIRTTQNELSQNAKKEATEIFLRNSAGFSDGDEIEIGTGPTKETRKIRKIDADQIFLTEKLKHDHRKGEPVRLLATWLAVNLAAMTEKAVELARMRGKIWTAASGNDGKCTDPSPTPATGPCGAGAKAFLPSDLAPGPDKRKADDPLMLSVGATRTKGDTEEEGENQGPEQLADFSNYGPQLSVVAGGDHIVLQDQNGHLKETNGTSFAAPTVAGLAVELLFLSKNLRGGGPFTPGADDAARARAALRVIELIEATADDLGTSGARDRRNWLNDSPANGFDIHFGHGRINVWKALLAVANGGTATDKSGEFPSLPRASTSPDTWFGFSIQSPVHDATLWIDGRRLEDADVTQATGMNALSAYKGVDSAHVVQRGIDVTSPPDNIPDEDPTSDVVPVGATRGEYVATFSIQQRDLEQCDKRPCTLSLRRPKEGADKAPFWSLRLELDKLRENKVPGVVFDDWVFEITPTDFGDAPQPYPSRLLADKGARSRNASLEWLGPNKDAGVEETDDWLLGVSPEPNAENEPAGPDATVDPDGTPNIARKADLDRFDEGVVFYPRTYEPGNAKARADFTVCVADPRSDRYVAKTGEQAEDKQVWVNGWIDWDTDGAWEETAEEHVVDGARIKPGDWSFQKAAERLRPKNVPANKPPSCATFRTEFKVAATIGTGELWARFRLDYGENAGRNDPRPANGKKANWRSDKELAGPKGPSGFGEVEDYLLGTDFGDAQDPPFPSLHKSGGAFVLNFNREWLGQDEDYARATRELDACDKKTSEEDRTPNLGPDCANEDADEKDDGVKGIPGEVKPGEEVAVEITVASQIDTRGFSNRGPPPPPPPEPQTPAPDSKGVKTLQLDRCTLDAIPDKPDTPLQHRDRGRYSAWKKEKRLFLNAWVDANANGMWENTPDEYFAQHLPVDPETFGGDLKYTLGEPFDDRNKDGVFTPGTDAFNPALHDVAGKTKGTFVCKAKISSDVKDGDKIHWRFRLDYGEDVAPNEAVVRFAVLGNGRNLLGFRGGSWWGEVEDYISIVRKGEVPNGTTGTTGTTSTGTTGATPTGTTGTTDTGTTPTGTTGTTPTGTTPTGTTPTETTGTTPTGTTPTGTTPTGTSESLVWTVLAFTPLLPFGLYVLLSVLRRRLAQPRARLQRGERSAMRDSRPLRS